MSAIDLPRARRLAFGVVLGQVGATVVATLAAWSLAGRAAALSALLGGGIASTGSLAMASVGFTTAPAGDARRALGAFYLGEAVKLALVVVLFAVVLRWLKVVPLAMFGAFAATFLVYWIALLGVLPASGGAHRGA